VNDGDVFFFDALPLVLQCGFDFPTLCEDKHARSPLVEAMDRENYFSRFETAFADVVVEDVLYGTGFIGLGFDGQ